MTAEDPRIGTRASNQDLLDVKVILGKHLRYEHNMSRRAVAENLGVKPTWVKRFVEEAE